MKNHYQKYILLILTIILSGPFAFSQVSENTEVANDSLPKLSQSEVRLILAKSFILPGWGEHSLGYQKRGFGFNGTEILCWLTYAAFQFYAQGMEKNMEAYAAQHAGVSTAGKDDQYYSNISTYLDIYEFNSQKLRYRQVDYLYPENSEYFWAWDSDDSRGKFDKKRINAAIAYRNATFAVTALIVNRVVSLIDIFTLTKDRMERKGPNFNSVMIPGKDNVTLSLNFSF